jgi:SulP family sulfate permease
LTTKNLIFSEFKGGLESAIQGFATSLGPILLYVGLFGITALSAGLWAAVITASVVHGASLLFKGQHAIIPGARVASLTAYVALVIQLAKVSTATSTLDSGVTLGQLQIGLAAGSVMFLVASVLVGCFGLLKFGNIFRMIPTPVTAGIANGTALLLIWLALTTLSKSHLASGVTAVGMVCTYLLWPRINRLQPLLKLAPAIVPAIIFGFLMAWMLEPALQTIAPPMLENAGQWSSIMLWPHLAHQPVGKMLFIGVPGAVTLALVMILETFTAAKIMETRFGLRVDPNKELWVLGCSNVVSAIVGGVPSTGSTVRSVASWQRGGRTWIASSLCLFTSTFILIGFAPWLLALPVGLMAGLILIQALIMVDNDYLLRLKSMLKTMGQRSPATADMAFWISTGIAMVAFFGNLIWACFTGIALSCLIVLRRLSENLSARWESLENYQSRRVRSDGEARNLSRLAKRVGVLKLSGHLFFGNSARMTELADEIDVDAKVAVIDVSQISDVDPSGLDGLAWLVKILQSKGLDVIATGVGSTKATELQKLLAKNSTLKSRHDLDRGLEAAEDMVLMHSTLVSATNHKVTFQKNELLHKLSDVDVTVVLMMGEIRKVEKHGVLFHKNDEAEGIWLLQEGTVSIVTAQDASASRLSTFGPGQFLGEMGFIDSKPRSATAVADTDVTALLLNKDALESLSNQQPHIALGLTRNIARELSNRVRSSSAVFMEVPSQEKSGWVNSSLSVLSRY